MKIALDQSMSFHKVLLEQLQTLRLSITLGVDYKKYPFIHVVPFLVQTIALNERLFLIYFIKGNLYAFKGGNSVKRFFFLKRGLF